jgi:hypothetical protein
MPVHALLGVSDPTAPIDFRSDAKYQATADSWATGISAYRDGLFDVAREALSECGSGDDPVTAVYRARQAALGRSAVPGWSPKAIPL